MAVKASTRAILREAIGSASRRFQMETLNQQYLNESLCGSNRR